ncbi:glutamate--cysteine ligase [Iodidimonas sp. SYSU 1G8]|uniref:glutamate--cysteine ligase n=1 Tax=Iodidimonas sp. SYSU 1G8 TaxID=3133967 RepID=UPI0031FF3CDD
MAGVPGQANQTRVESKTQLVEYIESGNKPKEQWRVGTEHEKFGFRLSDKQALPYDGPSGIQAVLNGMCRFGWEAVAEGDNIIALKQDGASITLEPGGQFELSGAPLDTIWQTCDEVNTHLDQVQQVSRELNVGFIGLGFTPNMRREDVPMMPKGRYQIMRNYMPKVGTMGLDMMFRTCTVQANLDYRSEADMVKKFRVSLALQPVATALFANSPFIEGKPNGYLSYRSHVWEDTDPDRCGVLPFVFEDGMSFERYVDYVLDVPMYFIYRDGRYIDVAGQSFRAFMEGRLPGRPGELPTMDDWEQHMTTVFPEVRLKKFLEMRGADGGPWKRLCALPALWVGLLYDDAVLDAAWDLVKDWSIEDHERLRADVPRLALKARIGDGTIQDVARKVLDLSAEGLRRRARLDYKGDDETGFLSSLRHIAETGRTQADDLLAAYNTRWNGSVLPVFDEYAY